MRKNLLVVMMTMILLTAVPAVCNADSGMTTPEELQARMLAGEKEIVVYTEGRDAAGLVSRAASMDEAENPVYEEAASKGDYLREAVLSRVDARPGKWDTGRGCYKTTLYPYYKMDRDQLDFVEETIKEVVSRCTEMSDSEKIIFFCNWLSVHIRYAQSDSVYQALVEGKGKCREYSVLFYLFCKEAGIDARTITGFSGDMLHEWDIVKIDGMWYHVDPTFYDTFDSDERHILRGSKAVKRDLTESYTASAFSERYPISKTDYMSQPEAPVVTSLVRCAYTCVAVSVF